MTELPKSVSNRLAAQQPASGSTGEHPDADLLTAFAERALSDGERERVVSHLAHCETCREVVSFALPPFEAAPEHVASHRTWFSMPSVFRWGVASATAVVVLAAVLLHQPEHTATMSDGDVKKAVTAQQYTGAAPTGAKTEAPAVSTGEQAAAAGTGGRKEAMASPRPSPRKAGGKTEFARVLSYGSANESNQEPALNREPARTASSFDAAQMSRLRRAPALARSRQAQASAAATGAGLASRPALRTIAPPLIPRTNSAVSPTATPLTAESARATVQGSLPETDAGNRGAIIDGASVSAEKKRSAAPRAFWSISSAGEVQRSYDKVTWQTIDLGQGIAFHVVTSIGSDVWAGGSGGVLCHSPDSGSSWQKVPVGTPQQRVSDTITRLEFKDMHNGTLTTATGDEWFTYDAGQTWTRALKD